MPAQTSPHPQDLHQMFDRAKELLSRANRCLILSHKNPDADSVGANLALREALEAEGKIVDSACVDPIPQSCHFLRKADQFLQDFDPNHYDLLISVDVSNEKLLGFPEFKPEILDPSRHTLLNIDHHASNTYFGSYHLVVPDAAATCFILFHFLNYYGAALTPSLATSLFQGLAYDTYSFMNSNTSSDCYRVAARLLANGADHARSIKEQFHTHPLGQLKLWGRALERAELSREWGGPVRQEQVLVTALTPHDFTETETQKDDASGLVAYLNSVPEADFCVLLSEDQEGRIRGSLRTQNSSTNLIPIAAHFGGGGHKQACGFTTSGHLQEKRVWVIA